MGVWFFEHHLSVLSSVGGLCVNTSDVYKLHWVMTVGLCFLHSFGQRLHRKEVFVKYKKGAVREKERGLHVSLMRRKFDEPVRTILTGHCSSPPVGQFPQAHVTNVKWSTLISLVAAKNGRSC